MVWHWISTEPSKNLYINYSFCLWNKITSDSQLLRKRFPQWNKNKARKKGDTKWLSGFLMWLLFITFTYAYGALLKKNFIGLFLNWAGFIIIKHREQDAQQQRINNVWRYHQLRALEHLGPLHHLTSADLWMHSAMGSGQKGYVDNAASLRERITACLNALRHLYELYHLGH